MSPKIIPVVVGEVITVVGDAVVGTIVTGTVKYRERF
jgi:hypothetical protein